MTGFRRWPQLAACAVTGALLLSACSSAGTALQAPLYAAKVGADTYRVTCLETSAREIYVCYNAIDTFYRDDGSEKTREEFCLKHAAGARG